MLQLVTGGTTGLLDGTLVDNNNKLDFSSLSLNTAINIHMRGSVTSEESDDTAFSMPSGYGELQVSFDSGSTWYGSADAPKAAPSIGPVNIPIKIRQTQISAQSSGDFTTAGAFGAATPPAQVTGVTSEVLTSTSVKVLWDAATDNVGVTAYKLEISTTDDFSSGVSTVSDSITALSHDVENLSTGSVYWARVSARDAAGAWGAVSAIQLIKNLSPEVADADVLSLSSTSETGYIATLQTSPAAFTDPEGYSMTYALERKLSTGSWDTPGDITTDATGLAIGDFPKTISGLTLAGGTYNVRTKCTDEQLAVTYSEVDSFVVIGYPHSFAGTSGDNPTSELFTTNETAAGVVQLNGSGQLVIATTADSDAGMVVPLANLTKTAGGGFKTKVKCNSWGAGFIIPLGLFQAANSPTYDSTTVMLDAAAGPTRALFRFLSATTMDVIYWNTSNAIKRWNRTGASTGSWVDSGNTPLTTSADTYYWVYLQPSTNGITFIVKDATDATVQMQTSEVAWTDIYGNGSANPYWAGFGDVLNNSSYGTQHWDDIDRA